MAITRAIKKISKKKLYQELGFQTLGWRCCSRKLCFVFKIFRNKVPSHLFKLILNSSRFRFPGKTNNSININARHNFLRIFFFPSVIYKWSMLDFEMRNSSKYTKYLKNSIHIHNPIRLKPFALFTHLKKNKFKYNFQGTVVLLYKCGNEIESKFISLSFTLTSQLKDWPLRTKLYHCQYISVNRNFKNFIRRKTSKTEQIIKTTGSLIKTEGFNGLFFKKTHSSYCLFFFSFSLHLSYYIALSLSVSLFS